MIDSSCTAWPSGCFPQRVSRTVSESDPVPRDRFRGRMLLFGWVESKRIAAFVLPSNISFAKALATCCSVDAVGRQVDNRLWIILPSWTRSSMAPALHVFSRRCKH